MPGPPDIVGSISFRPSGYGPHEGRGDDTSTGAEPGGMKLHLPVRLNLPGFCRGPPLLQRYPVAESVRGFPYNRLGVLGRLLADADLSPGTGSDGRRPQRGTNLVILAM